MPKYTTEVKVENYILQNIDASFASQINEWINGVEKYIDQYTGRNFVADSEATPRLYGGDNEPHLIIDECIEITKVEVGTDDYGGSFSEVSASGSGRYFTKPDNHEEKGLPIFQLLLNANTFLAGVQNNRVTAKWGYSEEAPDDIVFIATVLVAGILNQQRGGGDNVKSEKIGNYSVSYSLDNEDSLADFKKAMEMLDIYKRELI